MKKFPLPASIQELWTVWREIEGNAIRPCLINLFASSEEYAELFAAALLQDSTYSEFLFRPDPKISPAPGADLNVFFLGNAGMDGEFNFPAAASLPKEKFVAILFGIPEHLAVTCQREAMRAFALEAEQVLILGAPGDTLNLSKLAKRIFALFPDLTIPLARQFPVFREEAAWQEVEATAKQNAVVGLMPIPGGDMPVMTANQMKMILRIAAMYDLPMTKSRVKELAAVIGVGFGFRTTARQLVKFIPGPGWIVGGSIGYTGTLAMGKAAIEYFIRVTKQEKDTGTQEMLSK